MTLSVETLKASFERVQNENGGTTALGMRFYQRLFEKYPGVRPLFHAPPEAQHKKLMASLGAIIAGVTKPEELLPYLHAMGIRHLAYQTENAHYPAVAENLLAVLKEHLSVEGEWTPEMQETWEAALNTVATVMIEAAENPEAYKDEIAAAGYLPDGFRADGPMSRQALRPTG
jgi:methyl-accepting chemotaxis protein